MCRWTPGLLLLGIGLARAQPVISAGGVANAASYQTSVAQGSIFLIFGSQLGPDALAQAQSFPLQAELAGTKVDVLTGTATVSAWPIYVTASQVAAILPSTIPAGQWEVRVVRQNAASASVPISVVAQAPGLFSLDQSGGGEAVAQNLSVGIAQLAVNAAAAPALPGGTVVLWGTGLGPISAPDNQSPPAASLSGQAITVEMEGLQITPTYSGRSPCCSGLDQIVFTLPPELSSCSTGVRVRVGAAESNYLQIYTAGTDACRSLLLAADDEFSWKRISPATVTAPASKVNYQVQAAWNAPPSPGTSVDVVQIDSAGTVTGVLASLRPGDGNVWSAAFALDRLQPGYVNAALRINSTTGAAGTLYGLPALAATGQADCAAAVRDWIAALAPLDHSRLAAIVDPSLSSLAANISAAGAVAWATALNAGAIHQVSPDLCQVSVTVAGVKGNVELWRNGVKQWLVNSW